MISKLAERQRKFRADKKAQNICTRCGTNEVYILYRIGYSLKFTKCKGCLHIAALDQRLYRERIKTNDSRTRSSSRMDN